MEKHEQENEGTYRWYTAAGDRIRSAIRIILFFLTVFLCSPGVCVNAENIYIDEDVQQLFTAENGLPGSAIVAVEQTREGFIWLGGYGGLVRYDGNRFVDYEAGRLFNITDLLCGKDGTLWIASADAGLVQYKNDTFTYLNNVNEEIETKELECLAEAADGTIYFGTEQGIGYVDKEGVMHMTQFPELENVMIRKLACGQNGEIVCVARCGDVYFCKDGECRKMSLSIGNTARCAVFDDKRDCFYISTTQNEILVCTSLLEELETLHAKGLECINDIKEDQNGNLWACADNGVAVVCTDGKTIVQNLKLNNSIDSMLIDFEGNFWFASSRQGVLLVSCGGRFKNISSRAQLPEIIVNAIARLNGRLYIGHDDGMIILDENTCEQISDENFQFLSGARIRNLYVSKNGSIWVSTEKKGLWVLDTNGEWKQYSSAQYPLIRSDNFRIAYETDSGMLVGTDSGAYLVTEDSVENVMEDTEEMNCRILSIGEQDGTFYFGTDGYGMYIVKDRKLQEHLTIENGLCSNVVMKIRKDQKKQAFWLVTGNSLVYYDPEDGLSNVSFVSANNLDIYALEDGQILIMTGSGVYVTTEEVLLGKKEVDYRRYTRKDGLPYDITANSTPCMAKGVLYLCCSGGVVCMEFEAAADETREFSLVIDYLTADGEKYYIQNTDSVSIPKDVQRIEIQTHLVTNTMENPAVFYYMEDFDKAPKILRAGDLDAAIYTNLSGGDYTFHFGEYDDKLDKTGREITLNIKKEYKWKENPRIKALGMLIVVLFLIVLIVCIINLHEHSMKKKLKEKYEEIEKERLEKMVYIDHMTNLYNRHYLRPWEKSFLESSADKVTFLSADCNNLKKINDEFGHATGDRLLKETAELLQKYFHGSIHTVFRMGGDEFLVLCIGEDADTVRSIMEQMLAEAETHIICGHPITLCYGVHTLTRDDYSMDLGIRTADMEMICRKKEFHAGTNPYHG